LHFLEDDPELLGFEGDDLVVVSDLLDVFNLLSLSLLFDADNLLLKLCLLGELIDHLSDNFVSIGG
jgi:hypothetical protein